MKKAKNKITGKIEENVNLMNTPLMSILPGQISFFVILSIIPLASIITMIVSKLSLNFSSVTDFIQQYVPNGISNTILSIFNYQRAGTIDILFIITALYVASKATHSIIIASTQIYGGKQKDFLRTRIKAILMLIILVILLIGALAVFTIGSKFIFYLREVNGSVSEVVYFAYNILKWPFVFFIIFMAIKIIYTVAPNVKIPSNSVNKGALLTTIIWVITTYLYSFYITKIANYEKFYGNLSNIIILIIWIYWMSYVFVYGMTINKYRLNNSDITKGLD
ncbi:MAG: YihY/virulence factor BrkB family protein [Bacilli bacterium]|nr:YihY/virulence factor BrkB family protein [Bacilli bacterium]